MEENKQLTVTGGQVPAFVQEKLNSLAGALEYAQTLLKSGIAPAHFYHKGSDGKPDYSKGKPEAVVIVLQYGSEIGMSPMQALQQIVPVNNLVSVKGDGAKALIQRSGKLASWQETEVGTVGKDDWGFKIEATRKDTGEKGSSTFTVADAKRAGLWVDDAAVSRSAGLKYSPWYRHPKRMLKYRALGFLARDLFPDVLSGIYTEEEANDMNTDNTKFVAEGGVEVNINKLDTTESNNGKVAEKLAAKDAKKKALAGATTEKVVITPEPENLVASNIPYPEEPEVIESKPEPEKNQDLAPATDAYEDYLKYLRGLAAKDLGKEFRSKHDTGVLPFSVDRWVSSGGSKQPKDLVMVLDAANRGKLKDAIKILGLPESLLEPEKAVRSMDEQLELMDAIEAKGYDPVLLATELGFSSPEAMYADVDKEILMAKLNA